MKNHKLKAGLATSVLGVLLLSGCSYESLNSLPLPGDKGIGSGSYTVKVDLRNALNLVPNSPVLVDDINIGTIRAVALDGYTPVATLSLEGNVSLPENVSAKIAQTSLLGAKHIELTAPPANEAVGHLHEGSVIPLERTGAYPETEDVIASVATLLNGGGLQQIKTITTELNRALGGRTGTVRQLLSRSTQLATSLDEQKGSIVHALASMNNLAAGFRSGNATIARALQSLPPALNVLTADHAHLVSTLESLGQFGDTVTEFVNSGGEPLVRNVAALTPVLRELANAKSSLTSSLWIVPTVAFPLRTMGEYIRGDYINLWGTVDLGLGTLDQGLLTGTPLAGALLNPLAFLQNKSGLVQVPGPGASAPQLTVPGLTVPGLTGAADGSSGAGSASPTTGPSSPSQNPLSSLLGSLLGGGQ